MPMDPQQCLWTPAMPMDPHQFRPVDPKDVETGFEALEVLGCRPPAMPMDPHQFCSADPKAVQCGFPALEAISSDL